MKSLIRRHIIIATISVLLFIAAIVGLVWFTSVIRSREMLVVEARDRLASFEQNRRRLAEESEQLSLIRDEVSHLEQYIVTEDTTPTVLSSIESMAKAQGIDFTLTSVVATSARGDAPAKLHIDFSADGSFAGIDRFIEELLSQSYEVQVSRLSLYATTDSGKAQVWQLLAGIDIISF